MRALVVQTYPGANDAVTRHFPYWEKAGFDRIIGLVTDDGACKWPTADTAVAGANRYIEGGHLPLRFLQSVEAGLQTGASEITVIEYDVLLFKRLPAVDQEGVFMQRTGGPMPQFRAQSFYHCPWQMRAGTAQRVLDVGHALLHVGATEHGMPDWFVGLIMEAGRIPVIEGTFQRYTQNTIHDPKHLEEARAAYRAGVHAMHGIKTKEQLEFVVS